MRPSCRQEVRTERRLGWLDGGHGGEVRLPVERRELSEHVPALAIAEDHLVSAVRADRDLQSPREHEHDAVRDVAGQLGQGGTQRFAVHLLLLPQPGVLKRDAQAAGESGQQSQVDLAESVDPVDVLERNVAAHIWTDHEWRERD